MRELIQIINAQPSRDGDGVKIHRLAGRHLHRDHMGNERIIDTGDVQWVTAGV
jgi:hypothetical protein